MFVVEVDYDLVLSSFHFLTCGKNEQILELNETRVLQKQAFRFERVAHNRSRSVIRFSVQFFSFLIRGVNKQILELNV